MTLTAPPLTAEDVISLVAERDIRFIRLWFTDILGQLKAFSINVTELTDAFEGGMGFDGSSITGFNAIEESDMIAMPDPSTFVALPWRPSEAGVARMFCDIHTPERTAYEGALPPSRQTSEELARRSERPGCLRQRWMDRQASFRPGAAPPLHRPRPGIARGGQHRFSTRSGNDGKQPASTGQYGHENPARRPDGQ